MKIFVISLLLTLAAMLVRGQTTLSFCAAMRDENCVFNNTKFITSPDSTFAEILMLVRNAEGLGSSTFNYKMFAVDDKGVESLVGSVEQKCEPSWIYAWQSKRFKTPGRYKVRVYDSTEKQVCSKSFELFDVW